MANRPLVDPVAVGPDAPIATAPLRPDEVRVLGFDLDTAFAEEHESLLSPDERARADRFATAKLRKRFVARRGLLRQVLGELTATAAPELRLDAGDHGKPYLQRSRQPQVEFNLSHSGPILLIALSLDRAVGVDVERIRPIPEVASLVSRFFTPTEQVDFAQLSESERLRAFFRAWTRKEAYAKATGLGVAAILSEVAVSMGDVPNPQILSTGTVGLPRSKSGAVSPKLASTETVERRRPDPSAWRLCDVPTRKELAAAVVGAGNDWHLTTVRWPSATL